MYNYLRPGLLNDQSESHASGQEFSRGSQGHKGNGYTILRSDYLLMSPKALILWGTAAVKKKV